VAAANTIEIPVQVLTWTVVIINAVAVVLNMVGIWRSAHARRQFMEMTQNGLTADQLQEIHRQAVALLGMDADLLERILVDMAFLHPAGGDPCRCVVCSRTVPEIEHMIERLKILQANTVIGPEPPPPETFR
jgi:hypothetical protein